MSDRPLSERVCHDSHCPRGSGWRDVCICGANDLRDEIAALEAKCERLTGLVHQWRDTLLSARYDSVLEAIVAEMTAALEGREP